MLATLLVLDIVWFNISNNILLRKHDRDIALNLANSADLLRVAYNPELVGKQEFVSSPITDTLRTFSQTPGVSCVSISGLGEYIIYPPKNFCDNFEIRDTVETKINDDFKLVYHLNEKYLDEIKFGTIVYSSLFLLTTFVVFMGFNYLGYRNVVSVRIGELLNANKVFFRYNPMPTAEVLPDGTLYDTSLSWGDFLGETDTHRDNLFNCVTEDSKGSLERFLATFFSQAELISKTELKIRKANGHTLNVQAQLASADNKHTKAFLSLTDIDKLRKLADLRAEQALKDDLTGAGSRRSFYESVQNSRDAKGYYCFLIDIDDFKSVNDLYGHHFGDRFLQEFVQKYENELGQYSPIYRLGGEEFVFYIKSEDLNQDFWDRLNNLQNFEITTNIQKIKRTFSAGCTFFQSDQPVSTILKRCDVYLFRAKELGKARIIDDNYDFIFDDHPSNLMLDAIESQHIKYFFQPIVSKSLGKVVGYEALIRWNLGEQVISPQSFLNSYYKATDLLEQKSLRNNVFFDAISNLDKDDISYISYNIMTSDLRPNNLADMISQYQALTSDINIILEITESNILEDDLDEPLETILKKLQGIGFKIALDDFGKENSNFQRLIEWDIDVLKIDRSLITNICKNTKKTTSVKAIASLAKELDVSIIAEGVETTEDASVLARLGIDVHQGYLYGPPSG
jgi:diguanylate cyclase (GGDEF)-like protein